MKLREIVAERAERLSDPQEGLCCVSIIITEVMVSYMDFPAWYSSFRVSTIINSNM
jgi:hypothetical protein